MSRSKTSTSFEDDDESLVVLRFDGVSFQKQSWALSDSPDLVPYGRAIVLASETVRVHHVD